MDGITEAQQIQEHQKILRRKNPSLPEVLIVMVSAFDNPEVIQKCLDIGITPSHYLTKPIQSKKILPILKSVFESEIKQAVSFCDIMAMNWWPNRSNQLTFVGCFI